MTFDVLCNLYSFLVVIKSLNSPVICFCSVDFLIFLYSSSFSSSFSPLSLLLLSSLLLWQSLIFTILSSDSKLLSDFLISDNCDKNNKSYDNDSYDAKRKKYALEGTKYFYVEY